MIRCLIGPAELPTDVTNAEMSGSRRGYNDDYH
jgi:hypothetical protein